MFFDRETPEMRRIPAFYVGFGQIVTKEEKTAHPLSSGHRYHPGRCQQCQHGKIKKIRRENAESVAHIELLQSDTAFLILLIQKPRRYKKTANSEEDINPSRSQANQTESRALAVKITPKSMVGDDQKYCDRTPAIEGGNIVL